MTRDEVTGILHSEATLDEGFEKIPDLAGHGEQERDHGKPGRHDANNGKTDQ